MAGGSIDQDRTDQHGVEEENVPSVMDYTVRPQYLDATRMTRATTDAPLPARPTLPTLRRYAAT